MIRMANCCRIVGILLLIVAVVVGSSSACSAQWTTAGSSGTVDDADVSIAVFSGPTVTVSSSVATATLDIRYNVVAVNGLQDPGRYNLWACFRDNGASAQVIVNLKRFYPSSGVTTTLMTFDSNIPPASNNFQNKYFTDCIMDGFDFTFYVYYLEAALKKFSSAGNPGLSSIQLLRSNVPCP